MNFRAEVFAKTKNLALALQWSKEIEAASSLKDVINRKSITVKDVSDYEELDFMMTARIVTVPRKVSALPKEDPRRRAESSKGQPISQKESDCLLDQRQLQSVEP